MSTRVALVGASGKLGGIVRDVISGLDGFEVVHGLGSSDTLDALADADLVVDTTTPAVSAEVVRVALEHHRPVLVGTSGWSANRIAPLRAQSERSGSPVVIIPNFSLGSVIGSAIAAQASRHFAFAEIVEAHRDTKIDSPSGTAVRTAELIAASRDLSVEAPHVDQRARGQQVAGVPVHSLRRPGVIARQEVIFSGAGESLSIVHDTSDPAAAYAPGIRIAVAATPKARGVIVGLEAFLDLGGPA